MKRPIHSSHCFALLLVFICLFEVQAQAQRPRRVRTNGGSFMHQPRLISTARNTCTREIYRTIDGTCNNINASEEWGASDISLYREMATAYGNADPLNAMAGPNRSSPRAISNAIVAQSSSNPSSSNLSSFVFTWGQFLDHDITLTPESHTEYAPIALPDDETDFGAEIPFFRSEVRVGTGTTIPREQSNLITSWVDASNVYGSDITRANWLRTFSNGKLKTSAGNLLPYNTIDGEFGSAIDPDAPSMAATPTTPDKLFIAGDVRANEQPGLTTLHTLFVREHNRICDQLLARGITGDEELYQRARKQVGAIMQQITYQEFLPALGVTLPPYQGYKADVHPDIMNLFATAAYRLGHTMVTEELLLVDNNCNSVDDNLSLIDGFFNPTQVAAYGIAPFLKGLAVQTQEEIDVQMIDGLRNFLFAIPGAPVPFGLDLAALNLQRGRDHGLASYNQIRQHFLGRRVGRFGDITSDPALRNALAAAYTNVNDIDAWIGLVAEDHTPGTSLGPTLQAILGEQFQRLRDGDYYYFENDPAINGQLLNDIRADRLSRVIERNTNLSNLQGNVFIAATCETIVDNDGGGNGGNDGGGNPPGDGGGNGGPGGGGNDGGGNGGPGGGGNGGGGNGGGGNDGGGNDGGGNDGGGNGGPGGGGNGGPGGGLVDETITTNARLRIAGETPNNQLTTLAVFPNPSSGQVTVAANSPDNALIQVTLLGVDGKLYFSKDIASGTTFYKEQLPLRVPSGVYFVRVITTQDILTEKLIVKNK